MDYSQLSNRELVQLLKMAHNEVKSTSYTFAEEQLVKKKIAYEFIDQTVERIKEKASKIPTHINKKEQSVEYLMKSLEEIIIHEKENMVNESFFSKDDKIAALDEVYKHISEAVYEKVFDYEWYNDHAKDLKETMLQGLENTSKLSNIRKIIDNARIKEFNNIISNASPASSIKSRKP